jgi:myo-inositol-1(or 4)-monophosphatase
VAPLLPLSRLASMPADALLDLAVTAAGAAGALLLDRFGGPQSGVDAKSSATDMVSDADRDSERVLLDAIRTARPDDGLVAEESGDRPGTTGIVWVVDPLDGTTNYLYGIPAWSVSVACRDGDGGLVAVVHDPAADETFTAVRGQGAFLNGAGIRTTDVPDLTRSLIGTGFGYTSGRRALQVAALVHVLPRVRDVRRAGSAALDLAWVACGRLDGFYEAGIRDWDRAAGLLLVSEAGGRTGILDPGLDGADCVVAAGAGLYDPLCALVRSGLSAARAEADRLH